MAEEKEGFFSAAKRRIKFAADSAFPPDKAPVQAAPTSKPSGTPDADKTEFRKKFNEGLNGKK